MAINLKEPSADLYDREAEEFARLLIVRDYHGKPQNINKPSQLRRFYDQLVQLDDRIKQVPADFDILLPDIRMLNAHIAYAHGRKLVSDAFRTRMQEVIRNIEGSPQTLHNARLFFEATLGFLCAENAEQND